MDVLASARQAVDVWAPLAHHPALVGLRRSFVTSDYDPQTQPALCFAYDFHPGKIAVCVWVCECVLVGGWVGVRFQTCATSIGKSK